MTWAATDAWAAGLSYGGFNDWRLPATFNLGPASCDYDLGVYHGGTACGYNIDPATSELASLYAELGNKARYATNDIYGPEQAGWGFAHTGPFVNVPTDGSPTNTYWSGTEYEPRPDSYAWIFRVQDGLQSYEGKQDTNFAWALRDGDVAPVPLPAAAWLLLSGLGGLGFLGRRRKAA